MKYLLSFLLMVLFVGGGCRRDSSPPSINQESSSSSTSQTTTSTIVTSTAPIPTTSTRPTTTTKTAPPSKKLELQPNAPVKAKPGPQTLTVQIHDSAFSPQMIAINAGDTVVWTNKSSSNHTVASTGSSLWDSGNIPPGKSYSRVFKAPGTYQYHCGAHPNMKGTVVVY